MERFMGDDMLVEHGKDTPQMLVKYEDCVQEIALTKADAQATIADLLKYRASLPAQGSAGKHACDLPGCVSCGNPPDAEGETRA